MKKSDIPEKCKSCALYNPKSLYCSGYALRCATNNFKKCFTDIWDALTNTKTEYDYECENYMGKEGD